MKGNNLLVAAMLALAADAAAWDTKLVQGHWQQHAEAKQALIGAWRDEVSTARFRERVRDLTVAETYLVVYRGRGGPDERLVGHLAQSLVQTPLDFPYFAYAVFKHEVERASGFSPDPRRLFEGRTFRVYRRVQSQEGE